MVAELAVLLEARGEELVCVFRDVVANRFAVLGGDDSAESRHEPFFAEAAEEKQRRLLRVKGEELGQRLREDARLELLEQPFDGDDHLDDVLEVLSGGGVG